jgi:hypothetical protein
MCENNMTNITLSIPEDVRTEMRHFSEVKWSEVARKAIVDKLKTLHIAEQLAQKSRLTQKDVDDFSKKIKSLAAKRFVS